MSIMGDDAPQYLLTRYVFVDTEAFRRAQFDWTGKTLSKLVEFAKVGHLCLLTTEVTKLEITSQMRELLTNAEAAFKKYKVVLRQAGLGDILASIAEHDRAVAALDASFEQFLKNTRAISVPLKADLSALFSDYFGRRPPFSEKKKSEFPDAVTVASLLAWCTERRTTAYVVSGDPDLQACCSLAGPLFHAASVSDIISQATVSQELHEALEKALDENDRLSDVLADQIKSMGLESARGRTAQGYEVSISGRIDDVYEVMLHNISVIDQEEKIYTCEVEVEANLYLDLHIEIEGAHHSYGDYEPPRSYPTHKSIWKIFYAEVIVFFDPRGNPELEIESVHVGGHSIEMKDDRIIEQIFQ